MTTATANAIYDLLVAECGAREYWRENFVWSHVNGECCEYRFQGVLGFGGKFYSRDRWRVDCYPEDSTPELRALIGRVNARLATMSPSPPHGAGETA